MRICQVGGGFIPVLPSLTGGVEKYIHYLSAGLAALGHQVTVIDMPVLSRPASNYRVVEVPLRWRYDFNMAVHALRGLLFGWEAARRLERLIHDEGVDVVNFHSQFTGVSGIPIAQRYAVPTVFTMHNPLWSDVAACRSFVARTKFLLEQRAEERAKLVIGLSQRVMDNRVRYFDLPTEKTAVIPGSVDDFWFQATSVTDSVKRKYTPSNELLIMNVARLMPYKNQAALIRAMPTVLKAFPDARLALVGPYDSRSYLQQLQKAVQEAGIEKAITFAGVVPFEELLQLFSLACIFVLPSFLEASPRVVMEAMAQGKAIIASDIPPIREMVPEGTAILVPPHDHEALAAALIQLLKDGTLREEMGATARGRAYQVYHRGVVAQQVAQAYGRLLRGEPLEMGATPA